MGKEVGMISGVNVALGMICGVKVTVNRGESDGFGVGVAVK